MKMSRAVLAIGFVLGLSGASWAAAPAAGLGQAWPNSADLSRSPHYHVYAFVQGGVRYIQVNATDGTVLGAVGTSGGQYIVLPIGNATAVSTPQQAPSTSATPAGAPAVVYNDGTTSVTATPLSNGSVALVAEDICGDPAACGSHLLKQ